MDNLVTTDDLPVDFDPVAYQAAADKHEKIQRLQNALVAHYQKSPQSLALSLAGKTSNALSGSLNILMQVLGNLAQVQSIDDVRNAVAPALPLMTELQALIAKGEIVSVQYAQGISDEDAVVEGLLAMTQAAKIIKAQQPDTV